MLTTSCPYLCAYFRGKVIGMVTAKLTTWYFYPRYSLGTKTYRACKGSWIVFLASRNGCKKTIMFLPSLLSITFFLLKQLGNITLSRPLPLSSSLSIPYSFIGVCCWKAGHTKQASIGHLC
jgi:hypothetical protein